MSANASETNDSSVQELTLRSMTGTFLVLASGLVFALLSIIMEFIRCCWNSNEKVVEKTLKPHKSRNIDLIYVETEKMYCCIHTDI